MKRDWETVRNEIVTSRRVAAVSEDGTLLTLEETDEYLWGTDWIYHREYDSEQWIEVYSAVDNYVPIDAIIESRASLPPAYKLDPMEEGIIRSGGLIMSGFIEVDDTDIYKFAVKLDGFDLDDMTSAIFCFKAAAEECDD